MGRLRNFEADTVVERAMEEFWTRGSSPAQLAEATGAGKGSLYNTFSSKRVFVPPGSGPLRAVGWRARRGVPVPARDHAGTHPRIPARTGGFGCRAAGPAWLPGGEHGRELGGHGPEITRALRAIEERVVAALAARIDQGRRDGDARPDVDPRATAEFLLNISAGLRILAKTHEPPALYRITDIALTTL